MRNKGTKKLRIATGAWLYPAFFAYFCRRQAARFRTAASPENYAVHRYTPAHPPRSRRPSPLHRAGRPSHRPRRDRHRSGAGRETFDRRPSRRTQGEPHAGALRRPRAAARPHPFRLSFGRRPHRSGDRRIRSCRTFRGPATDRTRPAPHPPRAGTGRPRA